MDAKPATEHHVEVSTEDHASATVLAQTEAVISFEEAQHQQTRMEAFKQEWRGIGWCLYMFFICVMWGYEGLAGTAVIGLGAFRAQYGTPYEGDYVVDANWQLGFTASTLAGLVIGGFITGMAAKRWGRQLSVFVAYLINIGGVFIQFFVMTPGGFFAGKLLNGIALGCFTTVAPTYASEVGPLPLRGALAAGMNFAIVLGQLIGYGVLREVSLNYAYTDPLSFKILISVQWGFVAVSLAILPWFPESPYSLVQRNKPEKARKNLARFHSVGFNIEGKMAEIMAALKQDQEEASNQGKIVDCFKNGNFKRTVTCTSVFFIQNATGSSWVIGYMSYFMQLGGISAGMAFNLSTLILGLMVIGNMTGWILVEWAGRRGTALYGVAFLSIDLLLIGVLACINAQGAILGQVGLMAVWAFFYQATIGSAAWPIAAENPTSTLRGPTQALSTMMNGLSSCIWSFALPYAVNPDQGNLGGKIAFLYSGVLVVAAVFIYFFIPETKGRTYTEIDALWAQGVPPRKFSSTKLVIIANEKTEEAQD